MICHKKTCILNMELHNINSRAEKEFEGWITRLSFPCTIVPSSGGLAETPCVQHVSAHIADRCFPRKDAFYVIVAEVRPQ